MDPAPRASRNKSKYTSQKLSAFEKLKKLKSRGEKNKVELAVVENVYDEVTEEEYSKRVNERLDDDWIVDDGTGYVDDGTEIFDDDVEDVSKKHRSKLSQDKCIKTGQIKKFLLNVPSKKRKIDNVKLETDDMLDEVLNELELEQEDEVMKPLNYRTNPSIESYQPTSRVFDSAAHLALGRNSLKRKLVPPKSDDTREILPASDPEDLYTDIKDDLELPNPDQSEMSKLETLNFSEQVGNEGLEDIDSILDEWQCSLPPATKNTSVSKDIIDSSKLPLESVDNDMIMSFYWIDAYEDFSNHPGTVYLFGKVLVKDSNTYVSCCLTVKNVERRIFMLPRKENRKTGDPVTFCDVYNEFNQIAGSKFKILQFKSRKVSKSYCFGLPDVPRLCDYLEVRYSCQYPPLPCELEGDTFSHIFGTQTTGLELLILDLKLKGPCWLKVKNPVVSNPKVSWCKLEAISSDILNISVGDNTSPMPPLTVMVINVQLVSNVNTRQNEILAIGCLLQRELHLDSSSTNKHPNLENFCAVTKPHDQAWPWDLKQYLPKSSLKVERCESERSLLSFFLAKVHKTDPDLIIGFDIHSSDLDILLHRLITNKVANWSCIGRLKRSGLPKLHTLRGGKLERSFMSGRVICDAKLSAKELIRAKSYDLQSLCVQVLKMDEKVANNMQVDNMEQCFDSAAHLMTALNKTLCCAFNMYKIVLELSVLPLAIQITSIAGNLLSQTLLGGRSLRNEFLLLHAFHEKNYILPDKFSRKRGADVDNAMDKKSARKKPAYAGGLVLDPKVGFYDSFIILMDFNSLYPSIIQEYNICYTTIEGESAGVMNSEDYIPPIPDGDLPFGVLPTEIRKLVESRQHVKSLLKAGNLTREQRNQYDIRQKALKLTANSMYGCLGFSHSRFYCKPMAALITAKGREILLQTRELVQKMNLDVIYGDTDSIMINSNCVEYDEVWKIGVRVKQEVNKLYKYLELDIDGLFKSMLLLKKKKYAALVVEKVDPDGFKYTQELKGLDIVRRDWSQISSDCGKFVVDQILSDLSLDDKLSNIQQHLRGLQNKFKSGDIPLEALTIVKQLTKNPEDYSDLKTQPHVQVALRANNQNKRKLKHGDTVSYIICIDGSELSATQRAYSLTELKGDDKLSVDVNYYLGHQIHPVVSRLCEPIEGIDSVLIADCLGLDPSSYQKSNHHHHLEDEIIIGNSEVSDTNRFRQCDRLVYHCPSCRSANTVDKVFKTINQGQDTVLSFSVCDNPACQVSPLTALPNIMNQLTLSMRKYIGQYYEGWLICEDPTCPNRSKRIPGVFSLGYPVCNLCHKGVMCLEYSHSQLYNQLCYYQYTVDIERGYSKLTDTEKAHLKDYRDSFSRSCYDKLLAHVRRQLETSAFSSINLGFLFKGLYEKDKYGCGLA